MATEPGPISSLKRFSRLSHHFDLCSLAVASAVGLLDPEVVEELIGRRGGGERAVHDRGFD